MKKSQFTALLISALISHICYGNNSINMNDLCEKLEQCTIKEMQAEGTPPEMIELMKSMVTGQCQSAGQLYSLASKSNDLMEKAQACIDSRVKQDCEKLMSDNSTKACDAYEKAVDKLG